MRQLLATSPFILLAGCATMPATEGERFLSSAAIGERVLVDGPELTPLELLEDSRCPKDVQCIQAGTVRVKVAIHLGRGDDIRELELGKPQQVADGALELVEVSPAAIAGQQIDPQDYRFTFRFDGGL